AADHDETAGAGIRSGGSHHRAAPRPHRIAPRILMRYCAPMKIAVLLLAGCATQSTPQPQQFVAKVNEEAKKFAVEAAIADWIKSTYITDDTERNDATANERLLAYSTEAIKTAVRFKDLQLDPDTARALYLLRISCPVLAAPTTPPEL